MEERPLVKVLVVYDTRYGNTKLVAETIVEGIKEIVRAEAVLKVIQQVESAELLDYDLILIGSPNHYGVPTKEIKEFILGLEETGLEGKRGAVFDTYLGAGFFEKAVRWAEKRIREKAPGLELITPGLSIRVEKFKGPIAEGELPKCREFGRKIADQFKA